MSAVVIWKRRQKGGMRRVTPLVVTVVGRTPSGAFVIERVRRFRVIREAVAAKNIEPLHSVEGSA